MTAPTVVISQSNYLPWRGFFDMVAAADDLILYDSVQYTRRDWRNRNVIKTAQGAHWLTVPVKVKGRYTQPIDQTEIVSPDWAEQHIRSISTAYARAAAFATESPALFAALRQAADHPLLSQVNMVLTQALCQRLGIKTRILRCTDILDRAELAALSPSARLLELCRARGARRYLSGPSAKAYLDTEPFHTAGIEIAWMDYSGYPPYAQLWGDFMPHVSIIDLLLNTGDDAGKLIAGHHATHIRPTWTS